MEEVFLTMLRMGLVSGYVILVVLLVRRLLFRFPKRYSYLLWSVVFVRLVCPVGIEGPFSLIPDALFAGAQAEDGGAQLPGSAASVADAAAGIFAKEESRRNPGIADADQGTDKSGELEGAAGKSNAKGTDGNGTAGKTSQADGNGNGTEGKNPQADGNGNGTEGKTPQADGDGNGTAGKTPQADGDGNGMPGKSPQADGNGNGTEGKTPQADAARAVLTGLLPVLCVLWLAGMLLFWVIWARSIHRFRRKLLGAVRVEEGVYETRWVAASFVDGIFRPVIYLAVGLSGAARSYVLCHERVHVCRRDPLIKAAALFLVSVYWFHPLVWLAFKKMCEDMEMSCDERVVELLGAEIKKEYSNTLLQMAQEADEVGLLAAFGGNEVRSRVKNVLSYRKPKKWLGILLLLVVAAIGIGLGVNPGGKDKGTVANSGSQGNDPDSRNGSDGGDVPGGEDRPDGKPGEDGIKTGQDGEDRPDGKPGEDGIKTGQDGMKDDAAEADFAAGYAPVLAQYRTALAEKWEPQKLVAADLSILARYCYDGDPLENVGFAFLDVDGNDVPELFVGAIAGDPFVERQVFDLYTLVDGVPKQIFSGRERDRYYLCEKEDGSFLFSNEGSSGMAASEWHYCVLKNGELSWLQAPELRAILGNNEPDGEGSHMPGSTATDPAGAGTPEETEELMKEYRAKYKVEYMALEYLPFADEDALKELGVAADGNKTSQEIGGADLYNQISLILSQRSLWELDLADSPEVAKYTVTDLDQNGRLELIAASCYGTGIYTRSDLYEVSEDGTFLVHSTRTLPEEYSQADIIVDEVPAYFDEAAGEWNYIFEDFVKDGAAYSYESRWVWNFANGHLTERCFASRTTEYVDAWPVVTYHTGELEGLKVSDAFEYETAADRAFPGQMKGTANFWWVDGKEDGRTQEEWRRELEKAYEGFSVGIGGAATWSGEDGEFFGVWKEQMERHGQSEEEALEWYKKFCRAGLVITKGDWPEAVCIGDFDGNGATDCFFVLGDDGVMAYQGKSALWGSMNGEAFYHGEWCSDCIIGIFAVAGDVDHDGYTELVLSGDNGGCGSGNVTYHRMLKYRDGVITEQELPSDDGWWAEGMKGLHVLVYTTGTTGIYRAVLEKYGNEVLFEGKTNGGYAYYLDEVVPGWRDSKKSFGRSGGYSYGNFEVVKQDGKEYLLAKEYLDPDAVSGGIGMACLLFDWNEDGSAYVKDFYVEPCE